MKTRLVNKQDGTWWEAEIIGPAVNIKWGLIGRGKDGTTTCHPPDPKFYVQKLAHRKKIKGYEPV